MRERVVTQEVQVQVIKPVVKQVVQMIEKIVYRDIPVRARPRFLLSAHVPSRSHT